MPPALADVKTSVDPEPAPLPASPPAEAKQPEPAVASEPAVKPSPVEDKLVESTKKSEPPKPPKRR